MVKRTAALALAPICFSRSQAAGFRSLPPGAQGKYRFLFGDLYFGPDEAAGRENAWEIIKQAFAKDVS